MTVQRQRRGMDSSGTEQRRLRLRDWLEMRIGDQKYPGLRWENEGDGVFRIPWKHGARHGWREEEDARLFREWSEHTGASPKDVKQHKANFRCALNSLRDIERLPVSNNGNRGDDAYRLYRLLPKRVTKSGKKWIRKRTPSTTSRVASKTTVTRTRRSAAAQQFAEQQVSAFAPGPKMSHLACFSGSAFGAFPPHHLADLSHTVNSTQPTGVEGFPTAPSHPLGPRQPVVAQDPPQYTYATPGYHNYYNPSPSPAGSGHFGESATDLSLHGSQTGVYPQPNSAHTTVAEAVGQAAAAVNNYGNLCSGMGGLVHDRAPSVASVQSAGDPSLAMDVAALTGHIDTPPLDDAMPINYSVTAQELAPLSPVTMQTDLSMCHNENAEKYMQGDDSCQIWDLTVTAQSHVAAGLETIPVNDYGAEQYAYGSFHQSGGDFALWEAAGRPKLGSEGENLPTSGNLPDLPIEDLPSVKLEYHSDAISSDVESVFGDDAQIPAILHSFALADRPPLSAPCSRSPNQPATRLPSAYTLLSSSPNAEDSTRSPPWKDDRGGDGIFNDNFYSVSPAAVYGN